MGDDDGTTADNFPDRITVVREEIVTVETSVVGKGNKRMSLTENIRYSLARHFTARKAKSYDDSGAPSNNNGTGLKTTKPIMNAGNLHQYNTVAYNAPKQGPCTSAFKTKLFSKNEKVGINMHDSIN